MKFICIHYSKERMKSLTDGECNCDLRLKCPKEFQCPQYRTTKDK